MDITANDLVYVALLCSQHSELSDLNHRIFAKSSPAVKLNACVKTLPRGEELTYNEISPYLLRHAANSILPRACAWQEDCHIVYSARPAE